MDIAVEKPDAEDVLALLEFHVAQARAITPLEYSFALPGDELMQDGITFWTAREGSALLGFAALKNLGDGTGEVKSMRTAPEHLRRGVAVKLLETLIGESKAREYKTLYLETGVTDEYLAARRLYETCGFTPCDPFSDYEATGHNWFMRLKL